MKVMKGENNMTKIRIQYLSETNFLNLCVINVKSFPQEKKIILKLILFNIFHFTDVFLLYLKFSMCNIYMLNSLITVELLQS